MKDRIRQLMLDKAMSQKSFASELCIAEATLSGIFNGRTRPTNQTVNAIHECFPEVNISWLMFGEGAMYLSEGRNLIPTNSSTDINETQNQEPDLFSSSSSTINPRDTTGIVQDNNDKLSLTHQSSQISTSTQSPTQIIPQVQYIEKIIDKPQRKITEIRIFFDDGTYETFTP